jgi:RNA recognition motif-containing protein
MFYQGTTGNNFGRVTVVMADESTAKAAVDELDGAPLFDRRLVARLFDIELARLAQPRQTKSATSGWVASRTQYMNSFRAPLMSPPKNIFRLVREGRRVVMDVPQQANFFLSDTSALFYNYNVDAVSLEVVYEQKSSKSRRKCWHVDFSTREKADDAVRVFHKFKYKGSRLQVAKYQIPLKYLGASWDSGLPGAHFSGRDQGSAVGTNYEHVSLAVRTSVILCATRLRLDINL